MNSKKWFTTTIAVILILRLSLMALNYLVDPFDVFQTRIFKHSISPNLRFLKLEYLKANPKKYDSFIIGSSKAGVFDPSLLGKYLPNSKFYNLSVSESNLFDALAELEFLLNSGIMIKNVFMLVDFNFEGSSPNLANLENFPHPSTINMSKAEFYWLYLKGLPIINIVAKIRNNISAVPPISYDLGSGIWKWNKAESEIALNHLHYIENEKSFYSNLSRVLSYALSEDSISQINMQYQTIAYKLQMANIKLIVATPAETYVRFNNFSSNDYLSFLNRAADQFDFWNFDGYNDVTMNKVLYYDCQHMRPIAAEIMLARIFNDTNVKVPDNFGVLFTKSNKFTQGLIMRDRMRKWDENYRRELGSVKKP